MPAVCPVRLSSETKIYIVNITSLSFQKDFCLLKTNFSKMYNRSQGLYYTILDRYNLSGHVLLRITSLTHDKKDFRRSLFCSAMLGANDGARTHGLRSHNP